MQHAYYVAHRLDIVIVIVIIIIILVRPWWFIIGEAAHFVHATNGLSLNCSSRLLPGDWDIVA